MDKYLIEILKEVNTIIIPDFGALTVVNQTTGEVMFMSFMKFDDGKLIKHIAEKENWAENEAKNLVAKYVREINTKLDQGDTYDMFQFGSFTKNSEGEVEFIAPQVGNSNETSKVEEKVIAPIIEKVQEAREEPTKKEVNDISLVEPPLIEKPVLKVEETVKIEEIKKVEKSNDKKVKEIIETENIIPVILETVATKKIEPIKEAVEEVKETIVSASKILTVEEQMKDDLDLPPINEKKQIKKEPILEKTKKDKTQKKHGAAFYVLLIFLAVLLGGGIFFGVNYNKYKEYVPFLASNQPTEKEVEKPILENPVEENTINPETVDEITPESENEELTNESELSVQNEDVPTIQNSGSSFSIDKSKSVQAIAGSFTEASNAQRMVDKLKAQGLNAEIIAVIDGLNLVSMGSFNSMDELKSNQDKLDASGLKYWVYNRK